MKRVRVAPDRWNFEYEGGGYVTPLGGNMLNDQHPGAGTLFADFNAAECDRRFGLMADLGLNCLRQAIGVNQVFHPEKGLLSEGLKNWDTFIGLAQKHGVYLMPVGGYVGGNDWFDAAILADNGKGLEENCAFWAAFCGHYRGHPAIWAWDLRNELLYDVQEHMTVQDNVNVNLTETKLKDAWPAWLEARYGTVETMNRTYGSSYASFNDVPGSIRFEEKPFDLASFDFRNYLNDRGYGWCKAQCDVIREVAPGHMICSGNNTWLSPDQDLWLANGFHNRAVHDLFDFVSHHPYPALQCLPQYDSDPLDDVAQDGPKWREWRAACIGMSRLDYYGKPVVLQEWGWYGGGTSRFLNELPHRSEEEHALYAEKLCEALEPHINGFVNWPTFDMPQANDISNHGGLWTHDGKPKALAKVYARLAEKLQGKALKREAGTVTLQFSLLGLYTSRPVQDAMWEKVYEVVEAGETPDFRFV